jgi:hypothetical protein
VPEFPLSGFGKSHLHPQRPLEVARVVAHAELAPDQHRDALRGPALGAEARRRRTARQEPAEPRPGASVEARWPPGPRSGAQPGRPRSRMAAAPRQTLARLTPRWRAMAACVICPWRSSVAAAERRSSNCSGVKRAGRHSLPLIATTHDNAGPWDVTLLP